MKTILFLIISFGVLLTPEILPAQVKTLVNKIDQVNVPEEENLDVFHQWIRWNNPGSLLINHLTQQAMHYYDIRDIEIAKLKTGSDWIRRQDIVKEKLMELVGPFPLKTPLNPRITGTIKKDGFRVEKIIYECMPEYYVSACIFIPDGIKGKVPAVLYLPGHNQEAFRAELYQVVILNLVKKGIIVLTIDPPGQGERIQYFDPEINFSKVGYTVIEHNYFGNQCFLSGFSSAKYFIWEGIRGIDYLLSRNDVDPGKIGVTGFSGGGTICSYISAFDERVKVSVPCSWSTWNKRLLETKGVQDAESFLYNALAKGISFEDLLEVRAPKPTLLTFVSRDQYLNLQGARDAYAEAKRAYAALGMDDNIQMIEDDFKHWMTPKIRLAIYSFFMKHFNLPGDPAEEYVEILSAEELKVTPTGQISTSFGGDMIFDVNKRESEELINKLEISRKNIDNHLSTVIVRAQEISGYVSPSGEKIKAFINGRYQREGYSVGKYAIMGEGDYAIPFLLFVPHDNGKKHPVIIYIHPGGKKTDAQKGGEIEQLVKKGYVVAAVDVLGVGETKNTAVRGSKDGYTAVLTGRSVVGIQAADIARVADYLRNCNEIDPQRIGAVGFYEMCIPLIHAAAFNPSIKNTILVGSPVSYRTIVMNRIYKIGLTENEKGGTHHPYEIDFSWGVGGVLTAYDLPDLIGCIAPRKLVLADLKDQTLKSAPAEVIKQEMFFPQSVYSLKGVPDNLKITASENTVDLVDWCFK